MIDQIQQSELRRVGCLEEHAFTTEHAAGIDAVEATDELSANIPSLDAVGHALIVKVGEYLFKLSRYPRASLTGAIGEGAFMHDRAKVTVDGESHITFSPGFLKTAGNA